MKIVSLLSVLVASARALRPPFDVTHEVRNRMMQRKLTLSGKITGLSLIDAETSTKLADLVNGTVFDLSAMTNPTFNINASYTGSDIASVKFGHNGNPNVHMENLAWYSFCGNNGKNFDECSSLGVGNHTVTATPYSNRFAGGDAGASYTVSFSIVSGKKAAAAPVMAPVPTPIMPLTPVPIGIIPPGPVPTNMGSQPELLVFKLSSSTVNDTSGPRTVNAVVVFEDDGMGYYDIFVTANAPEGASPENGKNLIVTVRGANGSCNKPKPRDGGIGCNISLMFPQYLPEGEYGLTVKFYHRNYENFYLISPQQLKDQLMPHFIEVVSGNPDTTPPVLLDFAILSSTTLNVASETPATLDLQIVLQDDLSGVAFGTVFGDLFLLGSFNTLEFPHNNSKAGEPNTFNVSVPFSNYTPPQKLSLQFAVSDSVGNIAEFYNLSTIEIVNSEDNSPPQVLDFVVISPTTVNVTSGPAVIEMQVLVQDSQAGVLGVSIFAERTQTSEEFKYMDAAYYFEKPMAGQAVLVNLSLPISQYRRAGEYKLTLKAYDARGNEVAYCPDQLADRGYPHVIKVINNGVEDFTPPKLLNFVALTPSTVDVSLPVKTVTLQVVAQDNVSGVADLFILAYGGPGSVVEVGTRSPNRLPRIGSPVTFNITLEVQSSEPGRYNLELTLYDTAKNYAYLSADTLKAMNLLHSIEVIDPNLVGV